MEKAQWIQDLEGVYTYLMCIKNGESAITEDVIALIKNFECPAEAEIEVFINQEGFLDIKAL